MVLARSGQDRGQQGGLGRPRRRSACASTGRTARVPTSSAGICTDVSGDRRARPSRRDRSPPRTCPPGTRRPSSRSVTRRARRPPRCGPPRPGHPGDAATSSAIRPAPPPGSPRTVRPPPASRRPAPRTGSRCGVAVREAGAPFVHRLRRTEQRDIVCPNAARCATHSAPARWKSRSTHVRPVGVGGESNEDTRPVQRAERGDPAVVELDVHEDEPVDHRAGGPGAAVGAPRRRSPGARRGRYRRAAVTTRHREAHHDGTCMPGAGAAPAR
jgi:hypothetical protein